MAISKKISSFQVDLPGASVSQNVYIIPAQNINIQFTPEYYTGNAYDEAISGFLRHNLRGLRIQAEITYNGNIDPDIWRSFINDVIVNFVTDQEERINFRPNSDESNPLFFVVDNLSYLTNYTNQIGSFVPNLSLTSLNILDSIPLDWEAP